MGRFISTVHLANFDSGLLQSTAGRGTHVADTLSPSPDMGTLIRVPSRAPALSLHPRIPVGPRVHPHPHPHPPCTRAHRTPGRLVRSLPSLLVFPAQGGGPTGYLLLPAPSPSASQTGHSTSPVSHAAVPSRRSLSLRACPASACHCPLIPALRFSFRSPAHYSPPGQGWPRD